MMHHPNMHHQPMSGHPPQHMGGHQGMPGHHQMPPHQMHRENRHVTLTRVPLGASQGGGLGALGGAMDVPHHAPALRPPQPIRAMAHHPPQQHHYVPPQQMKPMRRPYTTYGPANAPVMPPMYPQPAPIQPQQPQGLGKSQTSPVLAKSKLTSDFVASPPAPAPAPPASAREEPPAPADKEAARPAPAANSKEKTPMCLVNELARYNKIKHQYRLTSETGPAHKKIFTVTLRLGDTEEYTAEGTSIKRAQHAAASAALTGTRFPPPPPRAEPAHSAAHPHHRHSVMPTVELNALAMKLCQPAVYTSVPPVAAPRPPRARAAPLYRVPAPGFVPAGYQRMMTPGLLYRVRVCVGGRAWLGEGATPQAARHDAAARALHELRHPPAAPPAPAAPDTGDTKSESEDPLNSEVKSPVSLVHELALKRNLSVVFTVKSERGPPHMRVFVTACTVGDMETEGEGNGKKVSKRRAAEKMLEEMKGRWPPTLLRPRVTHEKRKPQPTKKKPRNLIKEGGAGCAGGAAGGADNPISRLAVARHAARARSPQYRVLEERGAARRREFLVQCDAPPHAATGLGPNKKTAKRRAAHNVLLAMEMSANSTETATSPTANNSQEAAVNGSPDTNKNADPKRKESEGGGGDARQPVPGVLLMDYHQRGAQNGVTETTPGNGSSPGAKDQLMYLSQLLGFTVQFSDFPKRNHGEYLSLVSLSTEPPVMCHGGGASTQLSHEQCSLAALRALALMGLDAAPQPLQIPNASATPSKAKAIPNGIAE
ncbi:double-stranded RNA-binding protein Staufen homolog 2 isoform X2 [Amyelois transitella]|uniref:double-stranded RNA-binding protein Staufen homolog 2 isoform X2 n=1 Tax=Amyelois transitella TaxID=680683 RepID=UPI0029906821|nr:double-stranded RNA-binding protein Staufen homolog 2 isoform X2 [Amyelois transitella]